MDYDRIISSTYRWFSFEKLIWFLIFFWLSMPVLLLIPYGIEKQFFSESISWVVYILYFIIYLAVIVGFIALTSACLKKEKLSTKETSITRVIDTIFLVFVELWYVFVWNIHRSYRFVQLLLLIGIPLLYLNMIFAPSGIILTGLIIFVLLYMFLVIYNFIRVFFTTTIFYNKDVGLKEAVKESWHLTHNRFAITFFSIILVMGVVFVIFAIIALILGAVANVIFLISFTPPVAYKLAETIAVLFALGPAIIGYYFGVIEIYTQLSKEQSSSSRMKRILARRALKPKAKKTVKKTTKKKVRKKKVRKKKVRKKKK